jgi:protein HIRA/HIR1
MVIAEVPLWVVHSTAPATRGISNVSTASPAVAADGTPHYLSRATESIAFWDSAGARQKCSIYSIDIHPDGSKFATGGGDGTVRLWNSAALFRGKQTGGKYKEETNAYSSTSAPSSNEEEESELDEKSSTGGGAASSALASADEEQQENVAVHDLNQLVRRKKDGSTPVSTPAKHQPASSNAARVLLAPSPQQARESHHRLLCTMSAHTGSSVLCVRFSTSGDYLASAGDDAAVCIYVKGTSVAAAAGNLDQHQVEQWSRIKLCRGHTLDAVGLAWAPDDSHLVSCSLDSDAPIIVWKLTDLAENSGSVAAMSSQKILCHPYKILGKDIHTSTVKGVTFDPAGSYLASSGDDPAVCIWRAHDDWGLEKRIDDGIFRKWKDDERELSSQTLFRRLSWSTDGAYICSTNGTVKNKHVAAAISREEWSVSGSDSASAGAANLVGHKQPVVVSRHCPQLLEVKTERDMDDEDEEPDHATMVALGDKQGYVTIWSTRKSRPIFKLQCSESRCTVTDLAWGRVPNGNGMILLVSLLDGQVVALKFAVPSELGPMLSTRDQKRVFQLKYGIDLDDDNAVGRRRMFVGDHSAPRLIENALQFALEEKKDDDNDQDMPTSDNDRPAARLPSPSRVRTMQSETQSNGKKRIRPVLMGADGGGDKKPKNGDTPVNGNKGKQSQKKADPVAEALESAERAASAAEGLTAAVGKRDVSSQGRHDSAATAADRHIDHAGTTHHEQRLSTGSPAVAHPQLPHSTSRIHVVDLPTSSDAMMLNRNTDGASFKFTADCTNIQHVPKGSSGQPLPCAVVSISRGGKVQWKDEILGASL